MSSEDAAYGARPASTFDGLDLGEWSELLTHYRALGTDERGVLMACARKLNGKGRAEYGELVLATDKRNWSREAAEELTDAVVYCAIMLRAWADVRDGQRERGPLERMNDEP